MAKRKGESKVNFGTILKLLMLFVFIGVLIVAGIFAFKGYEQWKNPTPKNATTVIQNQTTIQQQTTIIKQAPSFGFYLVLILLVLSLMAIVYMVVKNRMPGMRPIDLEGKEEEVMRRLMRMGFPFYDVNGTKIDYRRYDKKKKFQACAWILPGSGVYYQKRDFRFRRLFLRFWARPKPDELMQPDWEPPLHEIYVATCSPYNILNKWQLLKPMTTDQFDKYIHDQEYGFIPSPEPAEAENIFELRRLGLIKDVEKAVFQETVKEGMKQ